MPLLPHVSRVATFHRLQAYTRIYAVRTGSETGISWKAMQYGSVHRNLRSDCRSLQAMATNGQRCHLRADLPIFAPRTRSCIPEEVLSTGERHLTPPCVAPLLNYAPSRSESPKCAIAVACTATSVAITATAAPVQC
eukprot:3577672-Pleurochrysis_carterae.AAC.1